MARLRRALLLGIVLAAPCAGLVGPAHLRLGRRRLGRHGAALTPTDPPGGSTAPSADADDPDDAAAAPNPNPTVVEPNASVILEDKVASATALLFDASADAGLDFSAAATNATDAAADEGEGPIAALPIEIAGPSGDPDGVDLPEGEITEAAADTVESILETASVAAADARLPSEAAPSPRTLLRFALAAVGVWLMSPLMSLVDTAVIGRFCSVIELASLGPATTLCDYMAYLFSWIAVATTNLSAEALEERDPVRSRSVCYDGVRLAAVVGVVLTGLVQWRGKLALAAYAGTPALVDPAFTYAKIRAWGFPAALVMGAAQSALLGGREVVLPLMVSVFAGVLNLLGDLVLVTGLKWGVAGVATATVASQYVGAAAMLLALRRWLRKRWGAPAKAEPGGGEAQPVLAATADAPPLPGAPNAPLSLPLPPPPPRTRRQRLAEFTVYTVPCSLTLAGKLAFYVTLTYVAAACGNVSLAAHQVMLSLFYVFVPFGDAASQTAQTFFPTARSAKSRIRLSRILFGGAAAIGVLTGAAIYALPVFCSGLFTTNAAIKLKLAQIAPLAMGVMLVQGVYAVCEGRFLSTKDMGFISTMYLVSATSMPVVLLEIRRRGLGIRYVWGTFLAFTVARTIASQLRSLVKDAPFRAELKALARDEEAAALQAGLPSL